MLPPPSGSGNGIIEQREFGKVKAVNKAAKRAWEIKEGRKKAREIPSQLLAERNYRYLKNSNIPVDRDSIREARIWRKVRPEIDLIYASPYRIRRIVKKNAKDWVKRMKEFEES